MIVSARTRQIVEAARLVTLENTQSEVRTTTILDDVTNKLPVTKSNIDHNESCRPIMSPQSPDNRTILDLNNFTVISDKQLPSTSRPRSVYNYLESNEQFVDLYDNTSIILPYDRIIGLPELSGITSDNFDVSRFDDQLNEFNSVGLHVDSQDIISYDVSNNVVVDVLNTVHDGHVTNNAHNLDHIFPNVIILPANPHDLNNDFNMTDDNVGQPKSPATEIEIVVENVDVNHIGSELINNDPVENEPTGQNHVTENCGNIVLKKRKKRSLLSKEEKELLKKRFWLKNIQFYQDVVVLVD